MSQQVTGKHVDTELVVELEDRLGEFVAQVVAFDQAALDGTLGFVRVLSEFLNAQRLPNPVVLGALASILGEQLSKVLRRVEKVPQCN